MRLEELKSYFDAGDLLSATICPAPLEPGPDPCWIVQFKKKNGAILVMDLDKKVGGEYKQRIFKSLDAAFSACKNVGFIQAKIHS